MPYCNRQGSKRGPTIFNNHPKSTYPKRPKPSTIKTAPPPPPPTPPPPPQVPSSLQHCHHHSQDVCRAFHFPIMLSVWDLRLFGLGWVCRGLILGFREGSRPCWFSCCLFCFVLLPSGVQGCSGGARGRRVKSLYFLLPPNWGLKIQRHELGLWLENARCTLVPLFAKAADQTSRMPLVSCAVQLFVGNRKPNFGPTVHPRV